MPACLRAATALLFFLCLSSSVLLLRRAFVLPRVSRARDKLFSTSWTSCLRSCFGTKGTWSNGTATMP